MPRPWIVRWQVAGLERSRSFSHQAQADAYRSRLLVAAGDGERFDVSTGEPVSWQRAELTVAEWAARYIAANWAGWSPNSRRPVVEAAELAIPLLVRDRAPQPPAGLRSYLRNYLLCPGAPAGGDRMAAQWLERWSLPLDDLTAGHTTLALSALAKGRSAATVKRLRKDLRGVISAAATWGPLDVAPLPAPVSSQKSSEKTEHAIDPARLPSSIEVRTILAAVPSHQPSSHTIELLLRSIYLAGWRPGEAIALDASCLELPETGWGEAVVRRSQRNATERWLVSPSERTGPPKSRAQNTAGRRVPLCPELTAALRTYLGQRRSGLVFASRTGGPLTQSNIGRAWNRAKRGVLTSGHPHLEPYVCRPYDLRHLHASTALRGGVPAPELARRLGHTVETLTRVYLHALADDTARANALLEKTL